MRDWPDLLSVHKIPDPLDRLDICLHTKLVFKNDIVIPFLCLTLQFFDHLILPILLCPQNLLLIKHDDDDFGPLHDIF